MIGCINFKNTPLTEWLLFIVQEQVSFQVFFPLKSSFNMKGQFALLKPKWDFLLKVTIFSFQANK